MKIAVIINHFPVLSETFILNQISGLINKGHHVTIFCMTPFTDQIRHADVEKYDLISHTVYYGSKTNRAPSGKIFRIRKAAEFFFANTGWKSISLLKTLNFFQYGRKAFTLRIFFLLVPFLENNIQDYDIAHCHYGSNGDLAVMLKNLGAFRGKIITTFHGEAGYSAEKQLRYANAYQHKNTKNLFEKGDLFLPMSEKERQSLILRGCDPRKTIVHRMGIDTSKFSFSDRLYNTKAKTQLLSVGRLVEKKGLEYAIRSVAEITNNFPHLEYNIAGDGPLRNQLKELICQLNMKDKIKILGAKTQEEIISLYKNSDLFLAPSVFSSDGDQEGVPVVIMEAMAHGLPVLSTRHAGIPELVQDGISGFLVPERKVSALKERLEYLLAHRDLWPQMGKAGREIVEKEFNIDKLNEQLVQMFHNLLNK